MKLIPKSFRFSNKDIENLAKIKDSNNLMNEIDSIRYALNIAANMTEKQSSSYKRNISRKYSDEEAEELVSKKKNLDLCPAHDGSFLSTCGCKDNGKLLEYYKGIME